MLHEGPLRPFARRLLPAALLAFVAGCGGAEPRPSGDAAPLAVTLDSSGPGADRLRAGEPSQGRAALEADLSADPDHLSALNDLGASYLIEGHGEAARRLLDEVVAKGSAREQQTALLNLGELYAIEGYLDAAGAYLETARALDKSRPEPWYALALLADARGDLQSARGSLSTATRLDDSGAARAAFAYAYPEEKIHLEALVAEQSGERGSAVAKWRELSQGRFAPLVGAAERHLGGE